MTGLFACAARDRAARLPVLGRGRAGVRRRRARRARLGRRRLGPALGRPARLRGFGHLGLVHGGGLAAPAALLDAAHQRGRVRDRARSRCVLVGSQQLASQDYGSVGATIWLLARLRDRRAARGRQPALVRRDQPGRPVARLGLREPAAVPGRDLLAADPRRVDDGRCRSSAAIADRRRDPDLAQLAPPAPAMRDGVTPIRARLARTPPGYRYSIGRILAIYSGLMVALLLAALDQTIVATALPRVVSELGGITPVLVGLHRLHARLDGDGAAVREARRRRTGASRSSSSRSRSSSSARRSAALAQNMVAARRLPRHPGRRRRRALPAHAGDGRDDRAAARPRPLPGADRLGLRGRLDRRAADRRASSSTTRAGAGSSIVNLPVGIARAGRDR